jgi:hypothetical protein
MEFQFWRLAAEARHYQVGEAQRRIAALEGTKISLTAELASALTRVCSIQLPGDKEAILRKRRAMILEQCRERYQGN